MTGDRPGGCRVRFVGGPGLGDLRQGDFGILTDVRFQFAEFFQNLIDTTTHTPEVRPAVSVMFRRIDAAPAYYVSPHRTIVKVRQCVDDFRRR